MSYRAAHELALVPDADEQTPNDLLTLDLEGRALVLDFGLFVLINLYCPNEGSDARFPYKMTYHLMLPGGRWSWSWSWSRTRTRARR